MGKKGFFGDQKGDLTIKKPSFPENTQVYCNEGTISNLKTGNYKIYLDSAVLTQIIPANNSPPDLDNYFLNDNEVILNIPLYNTENGHFRDVKKWLVFVMIYGDPNEVSFSYGSNGEKSKNFTQVLNIHFRIYFKALPSKNMQEC